jgi:cysteinylglycine-S-conjugate dipeptidase
VQALCKILGKLHTDEGEIAIPSILNNIPPLHPLVEKSYATISYDPKIFRSQTQLLPNLELPTTGVDMYSKLWRKPALIITAFEAGQGKKTGNVVMNKAWARLGLRLPPGMDATNCQKALIEFIEELTPHGYRLEIESDHPASGWETSVDHPYFALAREALKQGYGKETQLIGCGGSIPFVETLSTALGNVPALLTGVEDPLTLAHSENESLCIPDFFSAIKIEIFFLQKLAIS